MIKFQLTFDEPYMLGLLIKKSDSLLIDKQTNFNINSTLFFLDTTPANVSQILDPINKSAAMVPFNGKFGNQSVHRIFTNSSSLRIDMQFDYRNHVMAVYRQVAQNMYWALIGLIAAQFVLLVWRGVGLQTGWVLIEYLQLVSFMPIYNFRFIPYLYDAFKPALVSHLIIFDETPIYRGFDDDYFNKNYRNYWLSIGRLSQAFFFYVLILAVIVLANIVVFVLFKINFGTESMKAWVKKRMVQFKFNVYIRYYMLVYFDTTFFAVMKIFQGDNTSTLAKLALLLSYIVFVINIVVPVSLVTTIYRRFDILKIKDAKQSFNALLTRIDKNSKVRVVVPAYFFLRRCLTACLLTLPIDHTFIFL